nr:serine hydrolase domain-containing protein [Pacificimonas pallii]
MTDRRLALAAIGALGILTSTAAPLSAGPSASGEVLPEIEAKKIDRVFKKIGEDEPGCAIGVMKAGEVLHKRGYGLANLEHGVPITGDTVFRIASVSKQFTAMSTIILANEGKISLDDDIRKYVPEIPDYGRPITIRNIINHTSGLRDFLTLFFLKGYENHDFYMEPEFFEMLASQKRLEFQPGEKMSYTNTGYVLQAIIIERVTGMSLAEYAKAKIFDPLGMKNTHFHDDVTRLVPGRAYGYSATKKGYAVSGTPQELLGDGGVFTTIDDLARFNGDFYRGKVWRDDIKSEMITPGRLNDGGKAEYFPGVYYASGLIVGERRGVDYVRHAGQFAGFIADYIRFPQYELGIAALCNADNLAAPDFTAKVADLYLDDLYTKPAKKDSDDVPDLDYQPVSAEWVQEVVGDYHSNELGVDYTITAEGDGIALDIGRRKKHVSFAELGYPMFMIGKDQIGNPLIKMKFTRDESGDISGFTFDFSIVTGIEFERVS